MAECERLKECSFFQGTMTYKPAISDIFKEEYCLGDSSKCARYMVFKTLGKDKVPADLTPYMMSRAKEIISAAGK